MLLPRIELLTVISTDPIPVGRQNDIVSQLCVACLGAGVITTVAVAQVKTPIALGITVFSAVAAVMVGQVLEGLPRPAPPPPDQLISALCVTP